MNNLLSSCGLVDPRISASDKDLTVTRKHHKSLVHTGNNDEKLAINLLSAFVSLIISFI